MNRIFEHTPASEGAIVSRVLVAIHQAIDEHFPGAIKASRQFTKTVFSDTAEHTAADRVPGVPPPPVPGSPRNRADQPSASAPTSGFDALAREGRQEPGQFMPASSISRHSASEVRTLSTNLPSQFGNDSDVKTIRSASADWAMRLTLVALVAGIVFLVYVLLA